MTIFQYTSPTRIQFGPGAVRGLAPALAEVGKKRPLIVTDRGLAPLAPVTRTRDALALEIFVSATGLIVGIVSLYLFSHGPR
jgi:alcohol dehydrogenase class IV